MKLTVNELCFDVIVECAGLDYQLHNGANVNGHRAVLVS